VIPRDVPVDPDRDEAREWLEEELGRTDDPSGAETPSWLEDLIEWLRRLFRDLQQGADGDDSTGGTIGLVVVVAVVLGLLVAAFLIYGLPRLRRRSRVTGDLFGEDDDRDAATIRTAAERAASAGDWTTAVVELFRSLARGLAERGVVFTFPGTTARDFAERAGVVFPDAADRLRDAARVFDGVRYLGAVGTREEWERMAALHAELSKARGGTGPTAADALAIGERA
jgi:hypothetical protein